MRTRRQTKTKNVVIVCEGTDTECNYFREIKTYVELNCPDRYDSILIIPTRTEKLKNKNIRIGQRTRKLTPSKQFAYYSQCEEFESDYDKYRKQPTRYVREAWLFMKNDGYVEAWAVFDKDVHPDHKFAFQYSEKVGVRIAFSSYSFEEWVLCHYERNSIRFQHSECKNGSGQYIGCNSALGCRGEKCLAGYLRSKRFIPDYKKTNSGLFDLNLLRKASFNAAWLRYNDSTPIYDRNPYTDVDLLVNSLLGFNGNYQWLPLDVPVKTDRVNVTFSRKDDTLSIRNEGGSIFIIPVDSYDFLNDDYIAVKSCKDRILICENDTLEVLIPHDASCFTFKYDATTYLVQLWL